MEAVLAFGVREHPYVSVPGTMIGSFTDGTAVP